MLGIILKCELLYSFPRGCPHAPMVIFSTEMPHHPFWFSIGYAICMIFYREFEWKFFLEKKNLNGILIDNQNTAYVIHDGICNWFSWSWTFLNSWDWFCFFFLLFLTIFIFEINHKFNINNFKTYIQRVIQIHMSKFQWCDKK